jgi:hypothetical protein
MRLSSLLRSGLIAAALVAVPASATNLLVNGGFENQTFPGTTTGYYNLGGNSADHSVPPGFGWTVPVNNVDLIDNGVYTPFLVGGGAYQLDLVGNDSTGAISQSFATVLGRTYLVSLDYSANGSGRQAEVLVDGNAIGSLINGDPAVWQTFTASFVGTGVTTVFTINETIGGSFGGVALDNVSVSAVPEPASWTMLLGGFGMVGFAMRKRQAAVAA